MPTPSRNDIYEAVIRKMVTQALEEQEMIFEQNHGQDPDEALILYLCDSAMQLGYSPRYKEIIGWRLLERRFGSWSEALQRAGLPSAPRCPVTSLPRIRKVTEKQKELYRRRKAEKKLKNRQRMETQTRKKKETRESGTVLPPAQSHEETLSDCALDSGSHLNAADCPMSGIEAT